MKPRTDSRKFKTISRRELLKLTPVLALGAYAIPQLQKPLLKGGLAFSDWASARLFRSGHLAPTFAGADLTPFEKFPINDYDVDDPGVDFDRWTLTVTGSVQKPGDYHAGPDSGRFTEGDAKHAACLRGRVGRDWQLWWCAPLRLPQNDRRRPHRALRDCRMCEPRWTTS